LFQVKEGYVFTLDLQDICLIWLSLKKLLSLTVMYLPLMSFFAYQVLERVHELVSGKKINNRYLYFDGQLGELPTMQGFFCCGSRYVFSRKY